MGDDVALGDLYDALYLVFDVIPGSATFEEVGMRLLRLAAIPLVLAAGFAFVARLLKPRPVPRVAEGDVGYVPPVAADGPTVTVPDAVPLILPDTLAADQATPVG